MKNLTIRILALLFSIIMILGIVSCGNANTPENTTNSTTTNVDEPIITPSLKDKYQALTVSEAIKKANEAGTDGTSESFYVYGTVNSISNPKYGEMYLTDGTSTLYVYGTMANDETPYSDMDKKPVAEDEIVLYGQLKMYKDAPELGKSKIVEFVHIDPVSSDDYSKVSILKARDEAKGSKLSLTGVVAKITYANGMVPNGFYLVDSTGSIYVYGVDAAGQVKEGNTVTVEGSKDYYIAATEKANAEKYGYNGCVQIADAKIISNDNKISAFDTAWIKESTVKEIVETDLKTNITTNIYKVNALINKVNGTGFVNYYINDLDGATGSYVYTACNGSDFKYLDEFDGKICEVYLSAINCKSSASGCIYRFIPIKVEDKGFVFDKQNAPKMAIEYLALKQFDEFYQADPATLLISSGSLETLDVKDVNFKYSSSNKNVAYILDNVLHTKNEGKATITITATYGDYTYSHDVVINVVPLINQKGLNVKQAIESVENSKVTVEGIVGPSLINQVGFYLIDDTGVIAVKVSNETMATLKMGDSVVLTGTRVMYSNKQKSVGQSAIIDATIDLNRHGNNSYSKNTFIEGKSLSDLANMSVNEDHTAEVYYVKATINFIKTDKYSSISLVSGDTTLSLYCSSANQYSFLEPFAGKEVDLELALCNWNDKNPYKACVLSATLDGTTITNTLNFNK